MTEVPSGPPLAELGPRVLAFLIDWVGLPLALGIAVSLLGAIVDTVSDSLGGVVRLLGFVAGFAYWFWQVYEEGTVGQTVGKKQQHIRLVGADNGGQPIGFPMAFARNLVNSFVGLFWLYAVVDGRRQTIGDKVSKSIVVGT
jgi:uncharacterized RDD family membrane protein YckC